MTQKSKPKKNPHIDGIQTYKQTVYHNSHEIITILQNLNQRKG